MLVLDRFPGLGALPRMTLVRGPTPVMRLEETSRRGGAEIWVKRDDRTALPYGGNKVRKLEWLLGEARAIGARSVVTMGGYGSHHCLATAIYGARAGLNVHVVLFPQPMSAHADEVLRAMVGAGAKLSRVSSPKLLPVGMARAVAPLRLRGDKPFVIGPGGSSPRGALGYVAAGFELAGQIDAGEMPEPAAIFVPAGSGGTLAGILVGLSAAGIAVPVIGVRVTSKLVISPGRIRRLVAGAVALLRAADARFPDVTDQAMDALNIDGAHLGEGYGAATGAGERATTLAALDDLVLEPTYTAKTMAALLDAARDEKYRGPLLFLSTLSSAPMEPLLSTAPARAPFG